MECTKTEKSVVALENETLKDSGFFTGHFKSGDPTVQRGANDKDKFEKQSPEVLVATAQDVRDRDRVEVDMEKSRPQGFRMGQLRRRGHLFCLRQCGKQFKSNEEEERHYRRPEDCNNFPTPLRATFDPSKVPWQEMTLEKTQDLQMLTKLIYESIMKK